MIVGARTQRVGTVAVPPDQAVKSTFPVPRSGGVPIAVSVFAAGGRASVTVSDPMGVAAPIVLDPVAFPAGGARRQVDLDGFAAWPSQLVTVQVKGTATLVGGDTTVSPSTPLGSGLINVGRVTAGQRTPVNESGVDQTPVAGAIDAFLVLDEATDRTVPDTVAAEQALPRAEGQIVSRPTPDQRIVSCGWHGQDLDERVPAFGLVDDSGPLSDLVGARVRVTNLATPDRSVVVLLGDPGDIVESLSLSRRAFLALAPLATEELSVLVEVLA